MDTIIIGAPATGGSSLTSSFDGHPLLGTMGVSAVALAGALLLLIAVRGNSKRLRIKNHEVAGSWGVVVGTLFLIAGGMLASVADFVNSVPTSLLGDGGLFGNLGGKGAFALLLGILTFLVPWKRPLIPVLGGIACSVDWAQAGGIWGIPFNLLHMLVGLFAKVHG